MATTTTDDPAPAWPAGVRRAHETDPRVMNWVRKINMLDGDLAVLRFLGATKRQRRRIEQDRKDALDELRDLLTDIDNPAGTITSSGRRSYR